jgi:hypothetical protein
MKSYALVTVILAVLALVPGNSSAQSTPSLNLEGQGVVSTKSGPCANPVGSGSSFSATLSGQLVEPISSGALLINFNVAVPVVSTKKTAVLVPFGCRSASGTGTFEGTQYNVGFNGQFCSGPGSFEELSGTIWIMQNATTADITWATGTLVASGAIHIPTTPVPISGPMVVSIVGAVGEIPQFIP